MKQYEKIITPRTIKNAYDQTLNSNFGSLIRDTVKLIRIFLVEN